MTTTIEYREISGFPGYRVGSDGSIWTKWGKGSKRSKLSDQWKRLKMQKVCKWGHLKVTLYPGPRQVLVHRLVLESFVGPCPKGMECCHAPDPNPANNALSNLRWGTHAENARDMVNQGRSNVGDKHWRRKAKKGN